MHFSDRIPSIRHSMFWLTWTILLKFPDGLCDAYIKKIHTNEFKHQIFFLDKACFNRTKLKIFNVVKFMSRKTLSLTKFNIKTNFQRCRFNLLSVLSLSRFYETLTLEISSEVESRFFFKNIAKFSMFFSLIWQFI